MKTKAPWMKELTLGSNTYRYADIYFPDRDRIASLPFSLRILLENLLVHYDGTVITKNVIDALISSTGRHKHHEEIPFYPARVLMQDFTGVPAIADLSAMRDAVAQAGKDPSIINPQIPVDLIVDHSVQIDCYGSRDALEQNVAKEYSRNRERYELLKWAQNSFSGFRVVPPNSGICHQVNLEHLAQVVRCTDDNLLLSDTLLGTDSHTTMVNGLGVLGWGVGGIEAEAVMLGQPYFMPIPEVVGVKLTGTLPKHCTATDLVLTITQLLRNTGVVGSFVEFFGAGLSSLSLPDRATISNMCPEYGATVAFFPVDERSIEYLRFTGREEEAERTLAYTRMNGLFHQPDDHPAYYRVIELHLDDIEPSIAGPARPQDRIPLKEAHLAAASSSDKNRIADIHIQGRPVTLKDGMIVIAAITSCTNTSNPSVMLGAGLLAKNACQRGLTVPPWVKTSLAPGSKVVTDYLDAAELTASLDALGFHLAAYGCTTCIGNSGPLDPEVEQAQAEHDLDLVAVLSGNRNFSGRIQPHVTSSYLMSPILVTAYALAGTMNIDFEHDPIGQDKDGREVYLRDIWPDDEDIRQLMDTCLETTHFLIQYDHIFKGDASWKSLTVPLGATFSWDPESTYIARPPFFDHFSSSLPATPPITKARALLVLGDSVTTDHISPAGAIDSSYPAGTYLLEAGVLEEHFNSYGSRRGNHEVMIRGTFGNTRITQALTAPKTGGYTRKFPEGSIAFVFDAAMAYKAEQTDLIVLAGKEYGTGSSRDWAAKGTSLLGIKAVIAESYERIHRSNLVGMGVLPLMFAPGETRTSLGLTGNELFSIPIPESIEPKQTLTVTAVQDGFETRTFNVICRLDSPVEVAYYRHGGILPFVLREMLF